MGIFDFRIVYNVNIVPRQNHQILDVNFKFKTKHFPDQKFSLPIKLVK